MKSVLLAFLILFLGNCHFTYCMEQLQVRLEDTENRIQQLKAVDQYWI